MRPNRIVVLPGDGIGPEISAATLAVLDVANERLEPRLEFETHEIGLSRLAKDGSTFPKSVFEAAQRADGIITGPVSHSDYPDRAAGGINVSSELRKTLDLYANIRPSRSREGLPHWGRTGMDLVIVRENTEGFYSDRNMHWGVGEFMPTPDLALSVRKVTAEASRRIALAAFELAAQRRKKVTAVHKVNVIKISEGLFLREVRKVAAEFPGVKYEEQLIDSMAALLVRDAARFDVVVTTNMFGDIISDEAAELSGSLGLAGSLNAGDHHCMAQAQHGSAPDIAGKDLANPTSLILSAAMLLDWLGRRKKATSYVRAAAAITEAIDEALVQPASRTPDLKGTVGTRAFGALVAEHVRRKLAQG
ncbi:MAG: 3-isopropylmalate dehydrogenase [Verrucomicrobia bacterium]|nr:3-isopropylmalate dehydrogenase [Verrucomicrobiota bacterium]